MPGKTRGDGSSGQAEVLFSLDKVASMVAQGRNLVLAGDRALLKEVPAGKLDRWNHSVLYGKAGRGLHQGEDLRDGIA